MQNLLRLEFASSTLFVSGEHVLSRLAATAIQSELNGSRKNANSGNFL